jgi:hypothetical protein
MLLIGRKVTCRVPFLKLSLVESCAQVTFFGRCRPGLSGYGISCASSKRILRGSWRPPTSLIRAFVCGSAGDGSDAIATAGGSETSVAALASSSMPLAET